MGPSTCGAIPMKLANTSASTVRGYNVVSFTTNAPVNNAAAGIATLTIFPRSLRRAGMWLRNITLTQIQRKNSSHIENVENAAKQGYIRIRGDSSRSKFTRTNSIRTPTARSMPTNPQRIQDGKKDPRMLKKGAREHPVADRTGTRSAAIMEVRKQPTSPCGFVFMSWMPCVQEIAGLVRQSGES